MKRRELGLGASHWVCIIGGADGRQRYRKLDLVFGWCILCTEELRSDLDARGYPAKEASQSSLAIFTYQVYGPGSGHPSAGIFLLVIWDKAQQKLFLANDRFGLRPLYYAKEGNQLAFASEVKALLNLEFVARRVNDAAISDLFAFGHLYGEKTLFRIFKF